MFYSVVSRKLSDSMIWLSGLINLTLFLILSLLKYNMKSLHSSIFQVKWTINQNEKQKLLWATLCINTIINLIRMFLPFIKTFCLVHVNNLWETRNCVASCLHVLMSKWWQCHPLFQCFNLGSKKWFRITHEQNHPMTGILER